MPNPVYVIDASSLINMKRYIKPERQWDFFNETMTDLVELGELLITTQVEIEYGHGNHPDVPGTWVLARAKGFEGVRHPSEKSVKSVLAK